MSENDKINFKCNFENDLNFFRKKNSIRNKFDPLMPLMATTYPTDMTITLMVVAFWFMFAMTLDQV